MHSIHHFCNRIARKFHATVFDYIRNDALNANNWANNYLGTRRPRYRFNYFGAVSGEGFIPLKQTWGGKWLTDASFTVPLRTQDVSLTVGALNLFDVYPDKWASPGPDVNPFPFLGFKYGWETMPFGINGGYYYARVNVRLPH